MIIMNCRGEILIWVSVVDWIGVFGWLVMLLVVVEWMFVVDIV